MPRSRRPALRVALKSLVLAAVLAVPVVPAFAADDGRPADWYVGPKPVDLKPAAAEPPATKPAAAAEPATRPAAAGGVEVKLDRPFKVGDRTKVECVGAMQTKMVVRPARGGGDVRTINETAGLRLDGVSEVTAVDDKGHRTNVSFTVANCTLVVGKDSKELMPAGKVIEVRWDKDTTKYKVDGEDLPDEVGELFDLALELNDPASVSDDQIFNTGGGRRRVGDTWAIDPAAAVREFARLGLKTKEESLFGDTTLKEVKAVDGKPAMTLALKFNARDLSGPGRRPESKVKFVKGSLSADATVTVPVDPAAQAVREEGKVVNVGELTTTDEEGKPLAVSRTAERQYERTFAPAPAK